MRLLSNANALLQAINLAAHQIGNAWLSHVKHFRGLSLRESASGNQSFNLKKIRSDAEMLRFNRRHGGA